MNPVICLMGPTATGKTQLAMQLTKHLPCELISVDSAMVYRGLDIGTAKPTVEELKEYPHRLIDICDPETPYSAGQFYTDAMKAINDIHSQKRIPLLVGGTMLYFNWLRQGYDELPSSNLNCREEILKKGESQGWPVLHEELFLIDSKYAAKIHKNDKQRIQRALALYYDTGRSPSEWYDLQKRQSPFNNVLQLVVSPSDRSVLHQRIERRLDQMFLSGFVSEVEKLYQRKELNEDLPAIKTVGYRQVWDYLAGNTSASDLKFKILAATRQLARRQLIWLRKWDNAIWVETDALDLKDQVLKTCQNYISKI